MKTLSQLIQEAEERLMGEVKKCLPKKYNFVDPQRGWSTGSPHDERYQAEVSRKANHDFYIDQIISKLDSQEVKDFLKTELTNIVKESFKNTRVEENGKHNAKCEHDNNWCCTHAEELIDDEYTEYGYNTALSDKHNKECEFLGN